VDVIGHNKIVISELVPEASFPIFGTGRDWSQKRPALVIGELVICEFVEKQ
jgi:hypothetical protein